MTVRFMTQRILTGEWLDQDLPLSNPEITDTLSGPTAISGALDPERARLIADDGDPVLDEWGTWLHVEDAGQIRASGVVVSSRFQGPRWRVEAAGPSTYPHGIPYIGLYRRVRVDPLSAVREIWRHLQAQPDGDLGVLVDDTMSPVVLGESRNLLPPNVASGTDTLTTTEGFFSEDASLSSSTAFADEGRRSLKCDMGSSHSAGAQVFRTGFVPIEFEADYSFYGSATTGDTEPLEDFKITLVAEFFDQARDKFGTVVHHENFTLPKRGDWRDFRWEGLSSAFSGTAFVRLSVVSEEGDGDPLSMWADNLTFTEGTGVQEPYELLWWENPDCGQEIDTLARETPFDYRDEASWNADKTSVEHRVRLGYPRLGRRQHHLRFASGENIISVVEPERDGDQFANEVVGVGAGEGSRMLRVRIPERDGRLRRVHVVDDKTVRSRARMTALARDDLHARQQLVEISAVEIDARHDNAPFGAFHPGDDVLIQAEVAWLGEVSIWHRITALTYRPDDGRVALTLKRSDSYRYGGMNG